MFSLSKFVTVIGTQRGAFECRRDNGTDWPIATDEAAAINPSKNPILRI